jgi:hypothetical protein
MRILIMDTAGKREFIEVNQNDKVKDFKEKLANKKGINTDIKLHFNGDFLEDDKEISEYEIQEDEPVIYVHQFRGGK